MPNLIVLYDGVCGLCNKLVQFLLKRDRRDRMLFASLQSNLGRQILSRHDLKADKLDTFYIVEKYDSPSEHLFDRSEAILRVVEELDGMWKIARLGKLVPRFLRDLLYRVVAKNRYRVFGKYETCMMPDRRHRAKFLDI